MARRRCAPSIREDYLSFLWSAWQDWRAAGRPGDAAAYAWPVVRRRPLALDRIDARLGLYSFDASSPIAEGTWDGAYWSAQTALTALDAAARRRARGLRALPAARPPLRRRLSRRLLLPQQCRDRREAAVAAGRRVAILDVDYHHGNGTQDIFYARGDVLFVSIHADPRTDYPFFWGHADETGEGAGEGATLNLPLPRGTGLGRLSAGARPGARADRRPRRPTCWSARFGADTFDGDPISHFRLETADYPELGGRIAALGLPTLVVMEGGYAVDALGANVAEFLSLF